MSRRLGGAGKPARPILAAWAARQGAGFPAKRAAGQGCGDPRRVTAPGRPVRPILAAPTVRRGLWFPRKAAGVRDTEKSVVRRPVYGGPARMLVKNAPQGNLAGGPGVLRTPGRRPPHRNGGARRLSGYAAKSRSDAPTGGAQASPFLCFRPPFRRPMQKGWGFALSPHSHERTTIIRYVVKKMAAEPNPVTMQQGHAR